MHGIDNQLFGLHELKFRGYHLGLLGQELVENTVFYVISVKHRDGHLVKRYINAANWRIERSRERKALHPDLDETEVVIETLASDFRNVNGLLRSFHERQVNLSTSEALQTTIVREIKINPSFHRDHFECPRPIKRKA